MAYIVWAVIALAWLIPVILLSRIGFYLKCLCEDQLRACYLVKNTNEILGEIGDSLRISEGYLDNISGEVNERALAKLQREREDY